MFTRRRAAAALTLTVAALTIVLHPLWLRWLGEYLVDAQPPARADVIFVLGGDDGGDRMLTAGELVRTGYAPVALVSGPALLTFGHNEADLAIAYAAKQGYAAEMFQPLYTQSFSTRDEARYFHEEIRKRTIRKVIVVTSNYHTRRAGRNFRRALGKEIEVVMVAAPHRVFRPGTWWRDREASKVFLQEWAKTVADWAGL